MASESNQPESRAGNVGHLPRPLRGMYIVGRTTLGDSAAMAKAKPPRRTAPEPRLFDQARDELFSHILRCGVLEALPEHQK